ncbi:MAG: DNA polymerase I, partial [Deltaproteobacteria bacterium]
PHLDPAALYERILNVERRSWKGRRGVGIDTGLLERLGDHVDGQLGRLEREIYELAGSEFNLNSPVQLRKVLFDDLGLPVVKKTRTGPSTDQSVLEQLAASHPIAERLLEYRSLAKLKSTYIDVLPRMVNPATGRIHTRYNQTVTATGRLSSSDPNLQNIPVRTELGRRIREAFVAPRGHRLLSADYSQIELRILAHLTGDGNLIEAFERGEDIHAATAARIHGVAVEDVTAEMRYGAKAVNFGIVYGQGPYNLARQLGIERREAKRIIDTYFEMYPGVRAWIERVHEQARKDGYVTTMFGRRRKLPEISSTDRVARANAERIAQNTPIQGTAADIIKLAMIDLHGEMLRRGLRSRMVLQVHDELVFEVPKAELDLMRELAREKMEGAVQLNVPLVVDVADGRTWAEAHP